MLILCLYLLTVEWLLAAFGRRKKRAIEKYQEFVKEGAGQPALWTALRNQIDADNQQFVDAMQSLIEDDKVLSEIPASQRRAVPKPIREYRAATKSRNEGIIKAYESGDYTLTEIGEHFGLHYSTLSGIIRCHKSKT